MLRRWRRTPLIEGGYRALASAKGDIISSTYLTSDDMKMIERLLAEVRETRPERSFDAETARAHLLIHALGEGTQVESELRHLLAEHVKLHRVIDRSRQPWASETEAPSHGQEHMLPSPEEEFNTANGSFEHLFR